MKRVILFTRNSATRTIINGGNSNTDYTSLNVINGGGSGTDYASLNTISGGNSST
jgi:hypothetical protein